MSSARDRGPHEIERVSEGMRLRHSAFYLDARRSTELCFVSHAHSDHLARHKQTIATAETLRLAAARLGPLPTPLPVPYGQPFQLGELTLELLPAGHVLGSAQLRVTRKGKRLTYTGDLNPTPGLTAKPAEVAHCEVLAIESTFGLPRYRFPPREETYAAMAAFARRALADGARPVFFAYSLGKSQEAVRALELAGLPVVAHSHVADVCDLYRELGCALAYRRFDGRLSDGEVLVAPMGMARGALESLGPLRTAVLTGWALDPGAAFRSGTDAAFPLSDHGDFQSLVDYVQATGARKVLTLHGFAKELAACLRDRGIDAQPLESPRQMELF